VNGHSPRSARLGQGPLAILLVLFALFVPQAALPQLISAPTATAVDRQTASATSVSGGIAFRAAGAVASANNGGNVSPALPAGTAVNDILICVVENRADVAPSMAGWNTVAIDGTGANHHAAVFWRRATGGDPTTVTNTGIRSISARIYGFSGVDTTTALDATATITSSGADLTTETAAITTATPGAMIVFAAMMADNHTGFALPTGTPYVAWAGSTAATFSSLNLDEDHSLGIFYGYADTAGSYGPYTMTRSGGAIAVSHGVLLALRPASTAANFTINKPTGTAQDDVLIATIAVAPNTAAILPPSGWTEIRQSRNANTNSNQQRMYYRVAGAVEGVSYSWFISTVTAATTNGIVGSIVRFQNVSTTNPIDVFDGQTTLSGTAHATPATGPTTVPDVMLFTSHSFASSRTWTPGGSLTEVVDVASVAPNSANGISMSGNYERQAAIGAIGAKSSSVGGNADVGNAQIVALRPRVRDFSIAVAGAGNGCAPVLTITARDKDGNTVTNYVGTINLSVSTSHGDWLAGSSPAPGGTLANGAADDGAATYQFVSGDMGVVKLRLLNDRNESATVTVVDSTLASTSTTSASISFVVKTLAIANDALQIAGKDQAMTATIQGNGATCSSFSGSVPVRAYYTADTDHPGGATAPSISGMTSPPLGTSVPGADNLTLSFTNGVANFTLVTTDVGKYTINMRDASTTFINGNLDAASPTITTRPFALAFPGIQHSTDHNGTFLAKARNSFSATVTAYLWQAADDNGSGGGTANDGIPDPGANVTNNGTATRFAWPVTISAGTSLPSPGTTGAVTRGGGGAATIALSEFQSAGNNVGTATINNLEYSEVGNATLIAIASDYLNTVGATVGGANNGNSGLDGTGSAGGYVGRFTPAKFAVTADGANGPVLVNRVSILSCADPATTTTGAVGGGTSAFTVASAAGFVNGDTIAVVGAGASGIDHVTTVTISGTTFTLGAPTVTAIAAGTPVRRLGFSYMNEGFRVSFRLTAQNAANATTTNYTGNYAKLSFASAASLGLGALNGTTNLTSRLDTSLAPSGSWSNGVADVSVTIGLSRATPDTPDGPYDTMRVGIAPDDNDPVGNGTRITSFNLDVDNNATPEHASVGTTRARFGRLTLTNSSGAPTIDLNMPIAARYWAGAGFVTNTLDSCTSLDQTNLALDGYVGAVDPGAGNCKTFVKNAPITLSAGTGVVQFQKPAAVGSLRVTARLGAAGAPTNYCINTSNPPAAGADAALTPLLGRWNDAVNPDGNANTSSDDNPSARAAFGTYGAQPRNYIFYRENH
jgi:hypothetical protein